MCIVIDIHSNFFWQVLVCHPTLLISTCLNQNNFLSDHILDWNRFLVISKVGDDIHFGEVLRNFCDIIILLQHDVVVSQSLLIALESSLLFSHVYLSVLLKWWVIHADQLVEFLPALYFARLGITFYSCALERILAQIRVLLWGYVKEKVVIVQLTTLALHVVYSG